MPDSKILLVPMPRYLERRDGFFCFAPHSQIVIDAADAAVLRTAQRLQQALLADAATPTQIVVQERGNPGDVAVVLSVSSQVSKPQGYVLNVGPARIILSGHDAAGVFYGVCTLNQLIRQFGGAIPCLTIRDDPDFAVRGLMLDVSRSRVPTLKMLMELVDRLAGLKINHLELYMEHTFAYREHQEVWQDASPLTGQDILELDAFCRERFIDLVPNQNSLGHLVPWLTRPRYIELAEAPDGFEWFWGGRSSGPFSLNPTDPRSLDLLRSMYDDLLPHFSSRFFNVGCDESHDVGQGRSREICAERGVHRVYLDFLLQIYQLVKQRGRTMMFWGDIIIHQPELIAELPSDCVALEWGYEADHPFDSHGAHFARAGIPFYVCPGTSSWNSLAGRTDNAMGNLRSAAENGLKHGAVGYLNTDWGDHGHWQHLPTSYLGYTYGAAVSWCLQANAEIDLPAVLGLQVFQDPSGDMGRVAFDLGNVYKVYERLTGQHIHNASFLVSLLYMPVEQLSGQRFDFGTVSPQLFQEARYAIDAAMSLMAQARPQGTDATLVRREFANAAHLLRHACDLGEFKAALAQGLKAKPDLMSQADALAQDLRAWLAEYSELWLARNRMGGLRQGSVTHFQGMVDAYQRIAGGALPTAPDA